MTKYSSQDETNVTMSVHIGLVDDNDIVVEEIVEEDIDEYKISEDKDEEGCDA